MEVWLSPNLGFDPLNGTARIYGSGEAKISYVSAFNVADFTCAAATSTEADNRTLEIGGPDALSQFEVVAIFEQRLKTHISLQFVPEEALEQQHRSADPVQQTFAALMLGAARGDVIQGARELARQYQIHLHSVADYATSFGAPQGRPATTQR
jgi:NADH dehydrogenase